VEGHEEEAAASPEQAHEPLLAKIPHLLCTTPPESVLSQ
jgi:hypothetical protein